MERNLTTAKTLSILLYFMYGRHGIYLDVAGGYGLLVRLMRDIGFDFYWSDPYCPNLMAQGFAASHDLASFTAVTAFEVLEHVEYPVRFLQDSLANSGARTIIFSTELFEGTAPEERWWYYAFETGQHVSFFQRRTLEVIAGVLGLSCYSHGAFHMLSDRSFSPSVFSFLTRRATRCLSNIPAFLLESRTTSDHFVLLEGDRSASDLLS